MNSKKEYGDYQTPAYFADQVCELLQNKYKLFPNIVIEPTCGIGNFLKSSLRFNAKKYIGIDINDKYCKQCRESINDSRIKLITADIFTYNFNNIKSEDSEILILGNPPWITNSDLSALDSNNIPKKNNYKRIKGLDALTGSSNFDICEFIITKLIDDFKNSNTTISLLCKTNTARNIFLYLKENNINFDLFDIYKFDAKKIFHVSTNANLLVLRLTKKIESLSKCQVYNIDNPQNLIEELEYHNHSLTINNTDLIVRDLDGKCCFEWRQGVKHDCSKVMV